MQSQWQKQITVSSSVRQLTLVSLLYGFWSISTGTQPINAQAISDVYSVPYNLTQVMFDSYGAMIGFGTTYPVVTTYKLYELFTPSRVMLPPKSWPSLCGTSTPNATKHKIKRYRTRMETYDPVYLLITASEGDNETCSPMEIIENIARLNEYFPEYVSIISMLILHDNLQTKVDNAIYHGFNIAFVSSNVTNMIEKSIMKSANKSNTSPNLFGSQGSYASFYYMAVTKDFDDDGKITMQDYDLLYFQNVLPNLNSPASAPHYESYATSAPAPYDDSYTASDNKLSVGFVVYGILVGGFITLLSCSVLLCKSPPTSARQPGQRTQQLNNIHEQRNHLQQQRPWTPGPISTQNDSTVIRNINNTATEQNKSSLSEMEFASLPQMVYHAKKDRTTTTSNEGTESTSCNEAALIKESFNAVQQEEQEQIVNQVDLERGSLSESEVNSKPPIEDTTVDGNFCQSLSVFREQHGHSLLAIECCSICLEEFSDDEIVTALPRCCHLFHTTCIGQWILERKSNNCPLCKSLVIEKS
jgi:Ring finger domain